MTVKEHEKRCGDFMRRFRPYLVKVQDHIANDDKASASKAIESLIREFDIRIEHSEGRNDTLVASLKQDGFNVVEKGPGQVAFSRGPVSI